MKCSHCDKPATFHITELTGPEPQELHLCEDHARHYLTQADGVETTTPPTLAGALAQQLKIGQTAEELARLDQQSCPVCGITFYEFRNQGRLGCPHDYVAFESELEPLIMNIHGETQHTGKRHPFGPAADTLGYLIEGRHTIYFSGDTDLFPEMAELAGTLDVALLPVWGWGPNLGKGHMDPYRAAEALKLLQPSAIPTIQAMVMRIRGVMGVRD